eukprot:1485984-Rhodomonas_salina.2
MAVRAGQLAGQGVREARACVAPGGHSHAPHPHSLPVPRCPVRVQPWRCSSLSTGLALAHA